MIVLLPCPFCGGKAVCRESYAHHSLPWIVQCEKCSAVGPGSHTTMDRAGEDWNYRTSAPLPSFDDLVKRVEKLEYDSPPAAAARSKEEYENRPGFTPGYMAGLVDHKESVIKDSPFPIPLSTPPPPGIKASDTELLATNILREMGFTEASSAYTATWNQKVIRIAQLIERYVADRDIERSTGTGAKT